MMNSTINWYALRVQSRLANLVSTALRDKGFEEFLPVYRTRRRWSDRIKEIEAPLFPGYLFCRLDIQDRLLPVLTVPGVIGIVSAGKVPLPVSAQEIEAVQVVLRSGIAAQPWPFLGTGSKIYIEHGPLAGLEGIVINADDVCRLVVSVSMLQRSVSVEIDRDWVRPAENALALAS